MTSSIQEKPYHPPATCALSLAVALRCTWITLPLAHIEQLALGMQLVPDRPFRGEVDILIGGFPIARGDLLWIDGLLAVRISYFLSCDNSAHSTQKITHMGEN